MNRGRHFAIIILMADSRILRDGFDLLLEAVGYRTNEKQDNVFDIMHDKGITVQTMKIILCTYFYIFVE